MSEPSLTWACWREPGADTSWFLQGHAQPLGPSEATGFVIHPFEDHTGYLLKGEKHALTASWPDGLVAHPAPAFPQDTYPDYLERLATLIDALAQGQAEKVVFSRRKHLDREAFSADEAWAAFQHIERAYPLAFVSLVSVPGLGCWLSATPEVLCRRTAEGYYTMALAGTRSQTDPEPWHAKEYREQSLVVDSIQAQLADIGVRGVRVEGPQEVEAGLLRHLRSDFYFDGGQDMLAVARALHPTPAVGGLPRVKAAELIAALEISERGLYAGYVGYVEAGRPSALYVHLRCACLSAPKPTLFAGGGILADSDAVSEWQETEHKLQVLLSHLG